MSLLERALVSLSTWLLAITGAAYFYMKYMMTGRDPFSALHHPWQPHVLSLHLLLGPLAVFGLGLIWREHVAGKILDPRQKQGRLTGLAIAALAVPMVASGYLMQVFTDPGPRRFLLWAHATSGALYVLLFAGHLVVSRPPRRGANGGAVARARGRRRGPRLDRPERGV